MKLLILGGTAFLGRHLVEAALAAGHELTLFNRGRTNPGLFPAAEELHGDRTEGLEPLRGRRWDAVVDTCGFVPRFVGTAVDLLAEAAGHYTFVSSISAYADLGSPGLREDAPLATMEDETVEEIRGDTYGPLKALCEEVVRRGFPDRCLIVRPGLIVGPHDPTDRFTWWPWRMAQGGQALAAEPRDAPVQVVDARDLAAWMLAWSGACSSWGPPRNE